jgi:hypothetical protein
MAARGWIHIDATSSISATNVFLPTCWPAAVAAAAIDLQLHLKRCDTIDILAGCPALQQLLLEDCRKLTDLTPLQGLDQLHTLLLRNIRNLADVKPVAQVGVWSKNNRA